MMLNIQIVDDHKMVVESLSKLINDSGIGRITNSYYSLHACRLGLKDNLPDILLLDIGLPDGDGIDFCKEVIKEYPGLKVIILTSYREPSIVKRALHHGAHGYIVKNARSKELFLGISLVSEGEYFLCEEIDNLLKGNRNEKGIFLSSREKEVLSYLAEGNTTKEIAGILYLDSETVKTYRKNLLMKFEVRNVAELIKNAYEKKLIG